MSKSKFRHIYGDNPKPEAQFQGFQSILASGEGSYVAANHKFFSVARSSGGGPVYITRLDSPGRISPSTPTLSVHRGKVWDMDFHPFVENMIATASDDCRCNVTLFPNEGLEDNITEPTVELEGHSKKVILTRFNPSANNILTTAGFDRTVKVWNITKQACLNSFEDFGDTIYSLEWNGDGSLVGCTAKDRNLRFYDPRAGNEAVQTVESIFAGGKSSKIFWVPNLNLVGATGFSKQSKQELKLYSLDNLSTPYAEMNFGINSSVNYPFYDADLGVLYLYGKGNTLVHYIELTGDASRPLYTLNTYRATGPQKGGCWVPKRGLDVMRCEVGRFLKLTAKDVLPISFIVPRKAGGDIFQDDIFPDCASGIPALEADAWEEGQNALPNRMSMDPSQRGDSSSGGGATFVANKTYAELERENGELRARLADLEAQLNNGGGASSYTAPADPEPEPEPVPEPVPEPEPEVETVYQLQIDEAPANDDDNDDNYEAPPDSD